MMIRKFFILGIGIFVAGQLLAAELGGQAEALLNPERIAKIAISDPLTGEWLAAQRRILANLEDAIERDTAQSGSLTADYEYLLGRLADEVAFAETVPVIDENRFYNVREFGAKGDGVVDDGEAIRKAIAAAVADTAGKRTVFLPHGRYLVRCVGPETGNLNLSGLKNLRIVGERGTEILLPGALDVAVRMRNCDNVGLKNLVFTYRKAPYTTGTITGFPADDVIRVAIDPGMIAPDDSIFQQSQMKGLMRFYSSDVIPGTLRPRLSSVAPHQGAPQVAKVDDRTYDFKIQSFTPAAKHYAKGMHVAFYARTYGNHAIDNADSNRTRLENLTLNTSSAMAILNNASERPFVVNCRIEALPGSFVSTSADGIYMRNISLGGLVKGNTIKHVGDDFMNIHSFVYPAVKQNGNVLWLKSGDWNRELLAPGRRLGVVRGNTVAGELRIAAAEPEGELLKITLDGNPGTLSTLESTAGVPDMLMLPDNQSHGLVVTGNHFEDGLSRFLAGGRNWLFTDNVVIDSLSHSFFMNLRPEGVGRDGAEFVTPRNIELSHNRFETVEKTLFRLGDRAGHIRIVDNWIVRDGTSERPLFDIDNVEFLTVRGNRIEVILPQNAKAFEVRGGKALEIDGNAVSENLN